MTSTFNLVTWCDLFLTKSPRDWCPTSTWTQSIDELGISGRPSLAEPHKLRKKLHKFAKKQVTFHLLSPVSVWFVVKLGHLGRRLADYRLGEPDDGESLKQVGKDPAREYQVHTLFASGRDQGAIFKSSVFNLFPSWRLTLLVTMLSCFIVRMAWKKADRRSQPQQSSKQANSFIELTSAHKSPNRCILIQDAHRAVLRETTMNEDCP